MSDQPPQRWADCPAFRDLTERMWDLAGQSAEVVLAEFRSWVDAEPPRPNEALMFLTRTLLVVMVERHARLYTDAYVARQERDLARAELAAAREQLQRIGRKAFWASKEQQP